MKRASLISQACHLTMFGARATSAHANSPAQQEREAVAVKVPTRKMLPPNNRAFKIRAPAYMSAPTSPNPARTNDNRGANPVSGKTSPPPDNLENPSPAKRFLAPMT